MHPARAGWHGGTCYARWFPFPAHTSWTGGFHIWDGSNTPPWISPWCQPYSVTRSGSASVTVYRQPIHCWSSGPGRTARQGMQNWKLLQARACKGFHSLQGDAQWGCCECSSPSAGELNSWWLSSPCPRTPSSLPGLLAWQGWSNAGVCPGQDKLRGQSYAWQPCGYGLLFPCDIIERTKADKYFQHILYLKVFPFIIRNCSRDKDLASSASCSKLNGEGDPKWGISSVAFQFRAL